MNRRILVAMMVLVAMAGCTTSSPASHTWGEDRVTQEVPAEFAAYLEASGKSGPGERNGGLSRFVRLSSWVLL